MDLKQKEENITDLFLSEFSKGIFRAILFKDLVLFLYETYCIWDMLYMLYISCYYLACRWRWIQKKNYRLHFLAQSYFSQKCKWLVTVKEKYVINMFQTKKTMCVSSQNLRYLLILCWWKISGCCCKKDKSFKHTIKTFSHSNIQSI